MTWKLEDPTKPHSKLNARFAEFDADGFWIRLYFYRGQWKGAALFNAIDLGDDQKLWFSYGYKPGDDPVNGVLSGRRVYLVFAGDSLRNVTLGSIDEGQLSERELQVLTMIGEGKTNRDISQSLKISISSLETYRDRIKRKLGIDNARDLMRYAVQRQLED